MRVLLWTALLSGAVVLIGAKDVVNQPRINPMISLLTSTPGFSLGQGTRNSKVIIDAYLELVCPDSALAFPTLQEVVTSYPAEDVAVFVHQLPLPYHRNGFLLAQGYFQVVEKAPSSVQVFMDVCFGNISLFQGSTNKDKSENEFTDLLGEIQESVTGIPSEEFIADIGNYGGEARDNWKYGVRRGVAGTPWLFLNDVDLGVNPSDQVDIDTWRIIIDTLLAIGNLPAAQKHVDLDDILQEKNKLISSVNEQQRSQAAVEASQYLREIMKKNYFPVHNKQAVKNAWQVPQYNKNT